MGKKCWILFFFILFLAAVGPTMAVFAEPETAAQPLHSVESYLQIKQAVGARWLADGKTVVYRTNVSGTYQLWRLDTSGGEPIQITAYDDPVDAFAPSPADPHVLVFELAKAGDERTQLFLTDPLTGKTEALTADEKAIFHFGAWSRDGRQFAYTSNERQAAFFDVYVMDPATRTSRRVLQRDANLEAKAFSPSGERLVVAEWESSFNNNLYLVDLVKPDTAPMLLTKHSGWATYQPVVWPVGPKSAKGFQLISNLGIEWSQPAFMDVENLTLNYQDRGRLEAEQLVFSRNGVVQAYTLNNQGFSRIVITDISRNVLLPPPRLPEGVLVDLDLSPQGDRLLLVYTSPTVPAEVYVENLADGETKRLTFSDLAGIPAESFIAPKLAFYPTRDEKGVPAFVYLPGNRSAADKAPAVLYLHGGPESQERPGFNWLFQYFLSRGYAVVAPNIRGSSGYGKTYLHLDDKEKRVDAVRDVADAAVFIKKNLPQIDAGRLALLGGSYGGYLVLAGLVEYPDLFAAGVDIVGIANFETFLEQTGPWRRAQREAEYGSLAADRELLRRLSPLHRADQIRAPLLVIHGRNDPRVPLGEAEQIVQALRQRGNPVELLIYDDEGHGLRKMTNKLAAYPILAAFLERYLRPAPQPPASGGID
ncbi:MAG: S9 family peptidase [Myxococcales bacterium]|nr:S9 family peptidase [Myxococcales bacterium]